MFTLTHEYAGYKDYEVTGQVWGIDVTFNLTFPHDDKPYSTAQFAIAPDGVFSEPLEMPEEITGYLLAEFKRIVK